MEEHHITVNISNNTPKKNRFRNKLIIGILTSVLVISILLLCGIFAFCYTKYQSGKKMLEEKDYYGAIRIFTEFNNVEGSDELLNRAYYGIAEQHLSEKKYNEALRYFERANSYNDSKEKINTINSFLSGISLMESKRFEEAIDVFSSIASFSGAEERIRESHYNIATELYSESKYLTAIHHFEKTGAYGDSKDQISECYYNLGVLSQIDKDYEKSIEYFKLAGNHIKSNKKILKSYYHLGLQKLEVFDFAKAKECFEWADDYEDAAEYLTAIDYLEGHHLFLEEKYEEAELCFEKASHLDEEKYPPHFRSITLAENYLREKAHELSPTISIYVKEFSAETDTDYDITALIYNYIPHFRSTVNYDKNSLLLTVIPEYYPGHRILYAHKNNRIDILSDEEKQAYNKAVSLVETAKNETDSEFDLELWLHDWICNNTIYNTPDITNDIYNDPAKVRLLTCVGSLLYGQANCQGYSDTFYLLGNLAGLDVRIIGGMTEGPHAWNSVCIDNKWYLVDVTGNDMNNFSSTAKTYIWFNSPLNTEYHIPDGGIDMYPWMVESTDYSITYYSVNGLIFDNVNDTAKHLTNFSLSKEGELSYVMIKESDASVQLINNAISREFSRRTRYGVEWQIFRFAMDGNIYITFCWKWYGPNLILKQPI